MSYDRIWEWPPDALPMATERLTWLTAVRESQSGTEKRTQLRAHPRRQFTFRHIGLDHERQRIQAALWSTSVDRWLMPFWWDVYRDAEWNVAEGRYDAPGIGDWRDFQAGDDRMVITDGDDWQAFDVILIDGDGIYPDPIPPEHLEDGVSIYPSWPAAIDPVQPFDAIAAMAGQLQVTAELIDYTSPGGDGDLPTQYEGLDVLEDRPNRHQPQSVDYSRAVTQVDYGLGSVNRYDDPSSPVVDRSMVYRDGARNDVWDRRLWLHKMAGMSGEFWAPTNNSDLTVVGDEGVNGELHVEPVGWSEHYVGDVSRTHLYIRLRGGNIEIREITNALLEDDYESLVIGAFDFDADDVLQVSWLERCRIAADEIEMTWHTQGVTDTEIPLRTIRNDED